MNESINYVCPSSDAVDGGSIYDMKFTQSLQSLGYQVNVVRVDRRKSIFPPFWLGRFSKEELESIKKRISPESKTIISHESLLDLSKYIEADMFIVHNLFSHFTFNDSFLISNYYRLNSSKHFIDLINNVPVVLTISSREKRLLTEINCNPNCRVLFEPPGIRKEKNASGFQRDIVKISGTYEWLPKRLSKLKDSERDVIIKDGFKIDTGDDSSFRSNSLIEERFVVGFKLKLMQMLYRGDSIASFADLSEEVKSLKPYYCHYKTVEGIKEATDFFKSKKLSDEDVEKNRQYFSNHYNWDSIVTRIMEKTEWFQ